MLTQTWLVTWNMLLQLLLHHQLDDLAFSCHIHQKVHTVTSIGSVIVSDLPNLDCESVAVFTHRVCCWNEGINLQCLVSLNVPCYDGASIKEAVAFPLKSVG